MTNASKHEAVVTRRTHIHFYFISYLFRIHVVQVVLHKLHSSREVGLVELVRDVPPDGAELTTFLHCRV